MNSEANKGGERQTGELTHLQLAAKLAYAPESMTPAEKARMRPLNYKDLPLQHQWEIDKHLGLLDWDGSE